MTVTPLHPTAVLPGADARPVSANDRASLGRAFLGGCRAMLPWLAGVVPFGLTVGVTVAGSSIDPIAGWLTGPLIYAGSSQLLAIELLDGGAAPLVVIGTVLAVNMRLVAYSGAMAPRWHGTSPGFRALAAYLLIDPSYAVGEEGYHRHAADRRAGHAHYLGCGALLWVAWVVSITAGILVGSAVPDASLLALVVPLYLIAEIVRVVDTRPAFVAAIVGATVAIAGQSLPLHAGAVVAIAAGVAAAVALDRRSS